MPDIGERLSDLINGSVIIFASTLLKRLGRFISHLAIVRYLLPSEYGIVALIISVGTISASLVQAGIPTGVARLIPAADETSEKATLAGSSLFVVSILSLVATAAFLWAPRFLYDSVNISVIRPNVGILGLFIIFYSISETTIGILRAHENSKAAGISRGLFSNILGIGFLGYYIYFQGSLDVQIVLFYWIIFQFSMLISSVYYIHDNDYAISFPTKQSAVSLISYSWPLAVSVALLNLMSNIDILFLGYYTTSKVIGLYRAVYPITMIILIGLTSTVFLYLPLITKFYESGQVTDLQDIYQSTTKWISSLTFPVLLVFVIFSNSVVTNLIGTQYQQSSLIFTILSIAAFARVVVGPNGATAKAINRPEFEFKSAAFGFGINIISNLILIPLYSGVGAAVATLISYSIYNLLELYFIRRIIYINPFSIRTFVSFTPTFLLATGIRWLLDSNIDLLQLALVGILLMVTQVAATIVICDLSKVDRILLERLRNNVRG
jgi:O-antigen/teichoic acid export membrane protein